MMSNRRWWDVAVTAVTVIVLPVALLQDLSTPPDAATGVASVGLVILAYFFIARPELSDAAPRWRLVAFTAVAAAALVIGVATVPFLAMMQVMIYPLAWVIAASRRPAIIASCVFAVAVFFGFFIGSGFTLDGAVAGLITAVFSLAFSIAFGLWIASISDHAEERGRLLAELDLAQTELEALALDRGASQERERLARDIHDTLAQTLAGLVILAERAGRQSRERQTDAAAVTIGTVEQVARDALAESRALVARMAAVPSELAFEAAVERLAERFRVESGLDIEVDLAELAPDAASDREAQVVALRCLQESLANVRKHADATRVVVRADEGEGIRLVVSDDGRGFDPEAPRTGYGIDGMRDRLALAGGALSVESADGGTTLRIGIPLRTRSAS
ncbi:sensor histidine kinase [Microbacterium sp. RU33B]|uniref:sensor histidine kinase n=1 Tax=Microbacterium sp. RU33B TaxID=1907390 RepID=UPI00095B2A25|nr:sensor histidine kinase [Microbacterium sp. RU33B]SIT68405.1 Signal transduction histidine kinase [Microbacterium sp. RU33B]